MRTGLPARAVLNCGLGMPNSSPEPEETWDSAAVKAPRLAACLRSFELVLLAGMNVEPRNALDLDHCVLLSDSEPMRMAIVVPL